MRIYSYLDKADSLSGLNTVMLELSHGLKLVRNAVYIDSGFFRVISLGEVREIRCSK